MLAKHAEMAGGRGRSPARRLRWRGAKPAARRAAVRRGDPARWAGCHPRRQIEPEVHPVPRQAVGTEAVAHLDASLVHALTPSIAALGASDIRFPPL
jgi:hypothetical protein